MMNALALSRTSACSKLETQTRKFAFCNLVWSIGNATAYKQEKFKENIYKDTYSSS